MDNLHKKGTADRSKINMSEAFEVKYWPRRSASARTDCSSSLTRSATPPQRCARNSRDRR